MREILESVIDPETLSSIVDLGFIRKFEERGDSVSITLSPPTFWCPPVFLYMILEDLREKLMQKYSSVNIEIVGHHDSERLTRCINNGLRFDECYHGESIGGQYVFLKKRFYESLEKGVRGDGRENRLVRLSLSLTGEMCKLLAEERRRREGS
ncbi:MAG TPA: iron-sulfur cluster assembly protein [Sulfolobales archaeon]|nr:iron-sulfur cluster assembly protein [Sulfolobales archaeon]